MEQPGTDVARVHLERFCIRCGRYDLRVELPEPETAPASDRERWMAGQRRKALALRGAPEPEQWVCSMCGCGECADAGAPQP
jgi:hypothetical protein